MKYTTLCYLEENGCYLLMHRIKKSGDVNRDKWIGIGGKLEAGESPEQCLFREVREETGLTLTDYRFCGEIFFRCEGFSDEIMYLYHATAYTGTLAAFCDEGILEWVPKTTFGSLPMWAGDRIFLKLMEERASRFSLSLTYRGDKLTEAVLNGSPLPLS